MDILKMYLLFYSKKCKYSKKFVEILYDIGEDSFFKMVDVAKIDGKYPPLVKKYRVTEVPTAIVDGQMYIGQDAFKWLERKIKNINHTVSSQDTRVNKTPVISGYSADISSMGLSGSDNFLGNNSFAALNVNQKIETPDADTEFQKTPFVLPSDNITNGNTAKDDRPDRVSKMDSDLEKLLAEREIDTQRAQTQRRF
jgi:thiol-disulfide isomerase/thioredoxin